MRLDSEDEDQAAEIDKVFIIDHLFALE